MSVEEQKAKANAAQAALRARRKAIMEAAQGPQKGDRLSEMVMKRVREGVKSGDLVPTVKDGLAAEKLIDARIARTDDRATALTLAMILSGASGTGPPAHLLIGDGNEVEGEFTEVADAL